MPSVDVTIRAIDQGSQNVQKFSTSLSGIATKAIAAGVSLGALKAALGGVEAVARAAFAALNEGAQLELAQSRFENLAASIGTTADALTTDMGRATQGMMSQAGMVSAASDIISLGLADSGDEVVRLSNLVGQLGWDMQVLTLTMANDSMLRLDALGLSMTDVKERMEDLKAAGVAVDEAFDLAVIEAGEAKLELLGSAADSTEGKLKVLQAAVEDVQNAFKMGFAEGFADALDDVAGGAPAAAAGLEDIAYGFGLLSQYIPDVMGALTSFTVPAWVMELRDILAFIGVGIGEQTREARYNENAWADWATGQRQAQAAAELQQAAIEEQAAAVREAGNAVDFSTDQYWEMGKAQGALYGSFEYGQMVIEQQAAAVENLTARQEAYAARVERYWQTMADGGDQFMAQAGADAADRMFGADMTVNTDALNGMIIGIADSAGVGALGLADLNIQLGELEPAAARAMVAATVAQQAIEILINAWQGGEIDTSQLLGSIDAVIAELQNKTLPEIEIGIKAKIDMGEGLDIPRGEQRWMEMMGESPEIPIEANLAPFEAALAQALGQVTGSPADGRTLQILADYEAVTTAATTDIPAAIQGISTEARTVTFIPDDKAVQDTITALDQKHISIIVDYVPSGAPTPQPRAIGGPVGGNTPYIIGENGPEIFIPWSNGSIVPNHRIGGIGAGEVNLTMNFYGSTSGDDVRRAAQSAGDRLLERIRQSGVAA